MWYICVCVELIKIMLQKLIIQYISVQATWCDDDGDDDIDAVDLSNFCKSMKPADINIRQ